MPFFCTHSFPLDLLPVLTLLRPLSSDQLSAQSVFSHLHKLTGLTEAVSSQQLYGCVDPGQDEGTWILRKPRTLYGHGELKKHNYYVCRLGETYIASLKYT